MADAVDPHAAVAEFNISSIEAVPPGFNAWQIRNDYPPPAVNVQGGPIPAGPDPLPGFEPTPWLDVDFQADPTQYINLIKEYFMEGMIQADFVPQDNHVRRFLLSHSQR